MYPWHASQWAYLLTRQQAQTLPHALLLLGAKGLGKQIFAKQWIQQLLCQHQRVLVDTETCCRNCAFMQAGTHPDFIHIKPSDDSDVIKIDAIRELIEKVYTPAQLGGYKVVLITSADALNLSASNALLKIIEEPLENTLFLLVAEQVHRLMPTLRSRCQVLRFMPPSTLIAKQWLSEHCSDASPEMIEMAVAYAENAPLEALAVLKDDQQHHQLVEDLYHVLVHQHSILPMTEKWLKADIATLLLNLERWISDVIRIQAGVSCLYHRSTACYTQIQACAHTLSSSSAFSYLDVLYETRYQWMQQPHHNKQLLIEHLFLRVVGEKNDVSGFALPS